jgi:inosine/xanthosine triphosphate pyrophosphatase family protein
MPGRKRRIVLASHNEDKIRELGELCAGLPFEVASVLDYPGLPEVIEDGTTVEGNASRKAIVTAAFTGEIAIADDTAFQVRVLNDLPDIFASRFAGPGATYADNAALVLDLLREVPDGERQARFLTAAVWVDPRPSLSAFAKLPRPVGGQSRWLHNPFARAIHIRHAEQEAEFWNRFADRRAVWRQYRTLRGSVLVGQGVDLRRLEGITERLLAPYLDGARPADASPEMVHLPDTRIWTAASRDENEPPTVVTPTGLPADAPGREHAGPIWLEIATEGRLLGAITRQPLGKNGFGYDPIFRVADDDRTLAEFEAGEKNAISHRGRALRRLFEAVRESYEVKV